MFLLCCYCKVVALQLFCCMHLYSMCAAKLLHNVQRRHTWNVGTGVLSVVCARVDVSPAEQGQALGEKVCVFIFNTIMLVK